MQNNDGLSELNFKAVSVLDTGFGANTIISQEKLSFRKKVSNQE
jgi:hypothetical protein